MNIYTHSLQTYDTQYFKVQSTLIDCQRYSSLESVKIDEETREERGRGANEQ